MVNEAMLSQLRVPQANMHRIPSENPSASEAAVKYEETLRAFFHLNQGGLPRFDLVLLGLGTDAHTASIFPGAEVLCEKGRLVAAPWVEKLKSYRITMTPPVLNNGALILFIVSGKGKAEILWEVLQGDVNPERYSALAIRPGNGRLLWLVDMAAASRVESSRISEEC